MTADFVTGLLWVVLPFLGLAICAMQRDGRHYFPTYLILGLSGIIGPSFYLGVLVWFGGDVAAVRAFATEHRTSLVVYPLQAAFLLWSAYLGLRVLASPLGSRVDLLGRVRPPNAAQVRAAVVTIQRGERHGVMTEQSKQMLREDMELRRLMAMLEARRGQSPWGVLWGFLRGGHKRPRGKA